MNKNLKFRILTSLILILILFLMTINIYFLGYFLIIAGIISLIEFFNMNLIIFKKSKTIQLFNNILFIFYIFIFSSAFIVFSSYLHLKILLFAILLTCIASDIGGFVIGKSVKGPKLTKISPNKTISGFIGSIFFSAAFILFLFYYLTENINLYVLIIGLSTSIGSQFGDLFFSYLKRKSNLKDTGNLLPGHGGVLDRIDGILLGVPVGFASIILIY